MKFISACVILVLFTIACNNQSEHSSNATAHRDSSQKKDSVKPAPKMKKYWLVLLLKGKNRGQDSVSAARIQEAHMANINRLAAEGVLVMAGPMGYETEKDLRGIFILDVPDSATAAGFLKTDSAVLTGRLRFELHPWWTQTGVYEFK